MNIKDNNKMLSIGKLLKDLANTTLKIGVFEAVNNKDGKSCYVADYAISNEYGTEDIPERSFIRSTANNKQEEWSKLMSEALLETINNGGIEKGLHKVGAIARRDIIDKIDSNISPANAPSTLKRKGKKNKTLIDDGVLRNSIEARVCLRYSAGS